MPTPRKSKNKIIAKRGNKFLFLFIPVSAIFLFVFGLTPPAEAVTYYWTSQTVDTSGHVQGNISLKLDASNKAHISYADDTTLGSADLKYATNVNGSWEPTIVDSTGDVGYYSSLTLDGNGKSHISYYGGSGKLKYVNNVGGWGSPEIASSNTGYFTSIELKSSGDVYISFSDFYSLKYATKVSGTWSTVTVDGSSAARWTSLELDSNSDPRISYSDNSSGKVKYVEYSGGWGLPQEVDSNSDYASMDLDASNKAHIAYQNYTGGQNLKYAQYSGGWLLETVDSTGNVGRFPSLILDGNGKAHISYYDSTNTNLKYANNVSGWAPTTIDSDGDVGWYSSIALDSDGRPHIAYRDNANKYLKYAFKEPGNLLNGDNTNVLIDGGAGVADGITTTLNVTGDGRLRRTASLEDESSFTIASFVGDVYSIMELVLDDSTLNGTATLTFNYESVLSDPDFLATGFGEEHLKIFHINGLGDVEELPIVSRNLAANTITVTTTEFSPFGIGINPEPATLLLLGSALFGLLPLRKRFFQK